MSTLYVVATPLGNLQDLSVRAADVLRAVAVVAAEDTRRTATLLRHIGASPRQVSFHAHSPHRRAETLLEILAEGRDVALVSDAGTPLISDPGAELVRAVREAGHAVVPIPGPSAVATALAGAGLGGDRYLFLGFIPRKGGERQRLLERAAAETWPVVFFEAPGRLAALLRDLERVAGPEREAVVARELTKFHEEFRTGTVGRLAEEYEREEPRGEITLVLAAAAAASSLEAERAAAPALARRLLEEGLSRRDVATRLGAELGLPRNEAYRIAMEDAP